MGIRAASEGTSANLRKFASIQFPAKHVAELLSSAKANGRRRRRERAKDLVRQRCPAGSPMDKGTLA